MVGTGSVVSAGCGVVGTGSVVSAGCGAVGTGSVVSAGCGAVGASANGISATGASLLIKFSVETAHTPLSAGDTTVVETAATF